VELARLGVDDLKLLFDAQRELTVEKPFNIRHIQLSFVKLRAKP
jgi:hypothetical protein